MEKDNGMTKEANNKIEEFKKNFQDKAWLEENIEPYI